MENTNNTKKEMSPGMKSLMDLLKSYNYLNDSIATMAGAQDTVLRLVSGMRAEHMELAKKIEGLEKVVQPQGSQPSQEQPIKSSPVNPKTPQGQQQGSALTKEVAQGVLEGLQAGKQ